MRSLRILVVALLVGAVCVSAIQPGSEHENMRFGVRRDRRQDGTAKGGQEKPKDDTRNVVVAALKDISAAGSFAVFTATNGAVAKQSQGPIADLEKTAASLSNDKFVVVVAKVDAALANPVKAAASKVKQIVLIDEQYLVKDKQERDKLPRLDHKLSEQFVGSNILVLARFGLSDADKSKRAVDAPAPASFKETKVKADDAAAEKFYDENKSAASATPAAAAPPSPKRAGSFLQVAAAVQSKTRWYRNRTNGDWEYWQDANWNNIHFSRNTADRTRNHTKRDDRNYYYFGNSGGKWIDRFNDEAREYASNTSLNELSDAFDDWYR